MTLSDQPLLEEMRSQLKANDGRISVAVLAIVKSPQFCQHRALEATQDE